MARLTPGSEVSTDGPGKGHATGDAQESVLFAAQGRCRIRELLEWMTKTVNESVMLLSLTYSVQAVCAGDMSTLMRWC